MNKKPKRRYKLKDCPTFEFPTGNRLWYHLWVLEDGRVICSDFRRNLKAFNGEREVCVVGVVGNIRAFYSMGFAIEILKEYKATEQDIESFVKWWLRK